LEQAPAKTTAFPWRAVTVPFEALCGVAAVGFGLAMARIGRALLGLNWVIPVLAIKPLVDLTWRWSLFGDVAQTGNMKAQAGNAQALLATAIVGLTLAIAASSFRALVVNKLLVTLVLTSLLSLCLNPTMTGLNELLRLYSGLCFFAVGGYVLNDAGRFAKFAGWFLAAVSVPIVLSYLQVAGLLPFEYIDYVNDEAVGRASGTYPHPVSMLTFFLIALPVALFLWAWRKREGKSVWLLAVFMIAMFVAVALTIHRTAYIAMPLELIIWVALASRLNRRTVLIALGVLLAIGLIALPWLIMLFGEATRDTLGVGAGSEEFLRGRGVRYYLFLSSYVNGGPLVWLFGRGGSVANSFVPGFGMLESNEPHNDFLRLLHAYGLLGGGVYVWMVVRYLRRAWWLLRSSEFFSRQVGIMILAIVPPLFLMSSISEPLRFPSFAWYWFALLSLAEVQSRALPGALPPAV
jgi:O-antigen ligase